MLPNNRGYFGMHYETLNPGNQRVGGHPAMLRLFDVADTDEVGDYKECVTTYSLDGLPNDASDQALTACRGFNFGDFNNGKATQPIPDTIEESQGQLAHFTDLCYNLTLRINTLLGIGLGIEPPGYFTEAHLREKGPSGSTLRLLYYPPLNNTDARQEDVRAGAHSDYGSITLLFRLRGQAGLEILTEEGKWAPVPVSPPGTENDPSPPILVNIGDLLSYWTNGLLRSTVHRVIFPGPGGLLADGESDTEPRYSMAYFAHPAGTTELSPVPSQRVREFAEQHPDALARQTAGNPHAEKKVMTSHEHLEMRLHASYLQLYKDGDQINKK
jgi:isopenicillin N synthase-like dioxygenase